MDKIPWKPIIPSIHYSIIPWLRQKLRPQKIRFNFIQLYKLHDVELSRRFLLKMITPGMSTAWAPAHKFKHEVHLNDQKNSIQGDDRDQPANKITHR